MAPRIWDRSRLRIWYGPGSERIITCCAAPGRRAVSSSAALAERLRRRAGLLPKETREVRRVGKAQVVRNFVDRLAGEHQGALGFGQHALANEMACSHAARALDVVVEPVRRDRELFGVKADQPFFSEMLL